MTVDGDHADEVRAARQVRPVRSCRDRRRAGATIETGVPYSQAMHDATDQDQNQDAIRVLITETYAAMSSGESGTARFFAHPDIAIAGSGLGELVVGPEMAARMAEGVTRLRYRWTPEEVTVWVRGAFAWAQILGHVTVTRDESKDVVPYWTTGVFGRDEDGWTWRYWGGSEPQAVPRV